MEKTKKWIKLALGLMILFVAVGAYKVQSFFQNSNKKTTLATTLSGKSIKEFLAQKASADISTGSGGVPKTCGGSGDTY